MPSQRVFGELVSSGVGFRTGREFRFRTDPARAGALLLLAKGPLCSHSLTTLGHSSVASAHY